MTSLDNFGDLVYQPDEVKCSFCQSSATKQSTPNQKTQGKKTTRIIKYLSSIMLLMLTASLILLGCGSKDDSSQSTSASNEPQSTDIQYQIAREWTIPNGGYGRVIVIDPSHRNSEDMKALGDILKRDTRNDRNAFVFIFDDAKAAAMQQNLAHLNETDGAYYDQHFIGDYTRNINTGYHKLQIFLQGTSGPTSEVNY